MALLLLLPHLTWLAKEDARGGLAERADRLVSVLVLTGLSDIFNLPILLYGVLWVLAFANTYTVVFRVLKVRRQALVLDAESDADKTPRKRSAYMCGYSPGNLAAGDVVFNTGVVWFKADLSAIKFAQA